MAGGGPGYRSAASPGPVRRTNRARERRGPIFVSQAPADPIPCQSSLYMTRTLLLSVSLLVLAGCAESEPVTNTPVDINAAAIDAQDAIDAYGDNAFGNDDAEVNPVGGAAINKSDDEAPDNRLASLNPPAPGTPGGLSDDRTPVSEASFTPDSAQGAANVVQTYYALLGARKFGEARALWRPGSAAAGRDLAAFTAGFDRYSEYHANIGAPGRIDSGAGQRFVTVPVQVYARLKADRAPSYEIGTVTLHRVGDVDGATAEQRQWKIDAIALKPTAATR